MSTTIPGSRIRLQAIKTEHLSPALKIPENLVNFSHPTHPHNNKDAIDAIRYTGSAEVIDLRNLELLLSEVVAARKNGLNLGNTIDLKADKTAVNAISSDIDDAKGDSDSLKAAIEANGTAVTSILSDHIGAIGHDLLDKMFADYTASKAGHDSLKDYLAAVIGEGVPTPDGDVIVNMVKPWSHEFTVVDGTLREIAVPHPYTVGANSLEVFEGPMRMQIGATNDYVETSSTSVTFNYDLSPGTVIRFKGVEKMALYEWQEEFIAANGQREFSLMGSYNPGQQELMIFEDGMLMNSPADYIESSTKLITATMDLPTGTHVVVCKRR